LREYRQWRRDGRRDRRLRRFGFTCDAQFARLRDGQLAAAVAALYMSAGKSILDPVRLVAMRAVERDRHTSILIQKF
jgi:hypothetical protein